MTVRRSLYVMRHAKSDWNAGGGSDHDRPLAPRGTRAAATIGRHLAAVDQVPDFALVSSARRAQETFNLAREAGGWGGSWEARSSSGEKLPPGIYLVSFSVDKETSTRKLILLR